MLPYAKWMISASSMYETGHPKSVLWDNPEEQGREGGGRGFRSWGKHAYLWPIQVDVWQNHHNIGKQLFTN